VLLVVLSAALAGGAVYATLPAETTSVPAIELRSQTIPPAAASPPAAETGERPDADRADDGKGASVVVPELVEAGEDDPSGSGSGPDAGESGSSGGDSQPRSDDAGPGGEGDDGDGSSRDDDNG
jgi:hypothetical protein